MDIQYYTCGLEVECSVISAGHDGYCSGGDCEDVEATEHDYIVLEYFSPEVLDNLKYLESKNLLFELFNSEIDFQYKVNLVGRQYEDDYHKHTYGHQSGYCGNSPSGRKHETDFTVTKVFQILDETPEFDSSDSDWYGCQNATLNEKGLRDFVQRNKNDLLKEK